MESKIKRRNYQLDFIKLILTLLVFLRHAVQNFANDNTLKWVAKGYLGAVAVQLFFAISGMLMVHSYFRSQNAQTANRQDGIGKNSMEFVLKKYKGLFQPILISVLIALGVYIFCKVHDAEKALTADDILTIIVRDIPEFFMIESSGIITLRVITPLWYISAMLIVMLPMYYMLFKNSDFFLYIFAPLAALLTYGFMFMNTGSTLDPAFIGYGNNKFMIHGALIRAIAGVSAGVCSYTIYVKIKDFVCNKRRRVLFTVLEILLYAVVGYGAFLKTEAQKQTAYSAMLMFTIALAITFSEKSYVSCLFTHKSMRFMDSLSLVIYLNHITAKNLIVELAPDMEFRQSLLWMAIVTVGICIVYYLLLYLFKFMWNTKIKKFFAAEK